MDAVATAARTTAPPADFLLAALTATRLLGRWSLVCQRHGGGCSCCPGLGDIDMEEVERLLAVDLRKRHSLMQDREGFADLLKQCVARTLNADQQALSDLLEDIGRGINELERVQSGMY
ncbi:MAG: hypothetical protein EXR28_10305 [Betaproteobacteria bacterium]|nr:hypothetical protein [Betaproteobacteria bacterium]